MGLRRDVSRGVFWVAVSQAGNKAIAFVVQIILARILLPEDFGLVAVAYLAIDSLQLFSEFGFTSALIYRKDRVQEAAWNAFHLVLLGGVLTTAIGIAGAPTIAWFFKDPRITPLMRALSVTVLLSAFGQVPLTLLARELDFKKRLVPIVVPSLGNGLVSIICALSGLGVWSLVAGRVTHSLLTSGLAYVVTDWRPKWTLDRGLIGEMFDYGKHIVGSQLLVFAITNVDDTFVGRILDKAALGAYGLAYSLSNLPATQITRIVGQVMFPAFSRIQDDAVAMKRIFLETMQYIALLSIPISIGTIVFAGDFVYTLYGEKWAAVIVPLQWLGVYGLIRSIAANMGNIFKASGMTKWLTYIALWRLITMLLFLYPATKYYGIVGVSALSAAVSVVDFFISATLVNRIIHARAREYLRVLGPILLVALGSAAVARVAQEQFRATPHARIAFITALMVMVIVYVAGIWVVNRDMRHKVQAMIRVLGERNGTRYLGEEQPPK